VAAYLDLDEALAAKYPFAAIPAHGGDGWEIVFPDVPGVVGYAETWEGIGEEARSILSEWLHLEHEDGHSLPAPDYEWNPIKRSPGDFTVPRLYSTDEAANELGVSRRRAAALAKSRQVGQKIGNSLAFTDSDIDAMRERTPGRPPSDASASRRAS
jgi:predicted RNase H-like HicB family nuclease